MDVSPYPDARSLQPAGEHHELTSEVWLEHTGVHSPGHQIVRIESDGERATIIGHLALVPLNLAVPGVNARPEWDAVTPIRDEGALLIGPLWPSPGAGRWDGRRLVPA
jgi:glyoxylase-like metal-dependent hydrolase (beta-lactamase superfamily II)